MLIAQVDSGMGDYWCRVCGGSLDRPQWSAPAEAEVTACPHCYLAPAYHADNLSFGAAGWAEVWASEGTAEQEMERRSKFSLASERVPVIWRAGDILSMPLDANVFVRGQIVWVHPKHERIHLAIEARLHDHQPAGDVTPAPDVLVRTTDWLLRYGIWNVIGENFVSDDCLDMQFVARRRENDELVRVDPVTMNVLPSTELDTSLPTMREWTAPGVLNMVLRDGIEMRPRHRYLFTRSFEDSSERPSVWRPPATTEATARRKRDFIAPQTGGRDGGSSVLMVEGPAEPR